MKKIITNFGKGTSNIILLAGTLLLLNAISALIFVRCDVTDENLFTLSDGSKTIVKRLDEELSIKFFRSKSIKGIPVQYQNYGQKVEELLHEYKALSSYIKLEVLNPKPDDEVEEWALKFGLQSAPLQTGENLFLGAVFILGGEEKSIRFFDVSRDKHLEYDITQNIVSLINPGKKKIGILSSLDVISPLDGVNPMQLQGMKVPESWLFITELKKNFSVVKVEKDTKKIADDVDVLMVMHPKKLPDPTLYAIDQFVMSGKRLMLFTDPFNRKDLEVNKKPGQQQQQAGDYSSTLDRVIKNYGASISSGEVVADKSLALKVNTGQGGVVQYPVWMSLNQTSMNQNILISAELETMMIMECGSIKNEAVEGTEFIPLLESSDDAGTVQSFMLQFVGPDQISKQVKKADKKMVFSALLKGKFKSAFASGAPADADTSINHLGEAKEDNTIFLMADVDFIYDSNAVRKMNFFGQTLLQPLNDNLNFVMNAAEFLSGDESLISIRSRGTFTRPFIKVQELKKDAQEKWQTEDERLTKRIQEIQDRVNKLRTKREGNKVILSQQHLQEIELANKEMSKAKKSRREVRKLLREGIESLGNGLLLANLLIVPFLLSIVAVIRINKAKKRLNKNR